MNPLEANLTSRVQKRNKPPVTTTSTYSDEKRESELYDDISQRSSKHSSKPPALTPDSLQGRPSRLTRPRATSSQPNSNFIVN
ncbi:hypothetical protein B0I37DRAFT_414494 [Chaetomium sp. MPI-CAGE-AT-0009]|nr:hypothetical protein B0I37DRAFT_414494 [Chaetomium sp. MPI-CAGE-AT-0009]